jgi:alpha-D-ribose 1-methylphosphonate 5-triphosphate diphosphatase
MDALAETNTVAAGPQPRAALVINGGHVVLPTAIIKDAAILIDGGRIARIGTRDEFRGLGVQTLEATRALIMPGLIDTHNDGLEGEVNPRPGVNFQREFALWNYERRSVAAGVTTSFHAISFATIMRKSRSVDGAAALSQVIRSAGPGRSLDHQILHRLDVYTPEGLDPVFESIDGCQWKVISLNDHTPGQGQYRDLAQYRKTIAAYQSLNPDAFGGFGDTGGRTIDDEVQARIRDREERRHVKEAIYDRVQAEAAKRRFVLMSHDDDTAEKTDLMRRVGCTISEFPVSIEAASRARELGMWITVGAPNIVRGGSTSGNQSARELVSKGLADIICADYHAPSMLYAAFKLAREGVCDLVSAIAMVTANPAKAFGMTDRGRIATGLRADLCVMLENHELPVVQTVIRGGDIVFASWPTARSPAPVTVGAHS